MYAFTELHNDYPAFVNLTEQSDGTLKLTVRTRGNCGRDCASINLAPAQAEELAEAIFKHVYAGESEVATPPAQDAGTGEPLALLIELNAALRKAWDARELPASVVSGDLTRRVYACIANSGRTDE